MRHISFGWTTPPLLAGVKRVTRRSWKDVHAARHHEGMQLRAWSKDPRYGGEPIAVVRLTADPVYGGAETAPASDFADEGFEWFMGHPWCLPEDFRKRLVTDSRGLISRESFERWLSNDYQFWVVRFEVESWEVSPAEYLARYHIEGLERAAGKVLQPSAVAEWMARENDLLDGLSPTSTVVAGYPERVHGLIEALADGVHL